MLLVRASRTAAIPEDGAFSWRHFNCLNVHCLDGYSPCSTTPGFIAPLANDSRCSMDANGLIFSQQVFTSVVPGIGRSHGRHESGGFAVADAERSLSPA